MRQNYTKNKNIRAGNPHPNPNPNPKSESDPIFGQKTQSESVSESAI